MKKVPETYTSNSRVRSGAILICVLVCLGIASTITLEALRTSLQQRRQIQRHWQMEQTQWVLEAGFQRALRLRRDQPEYQGETWQIDAALPKQLVASVEIQFEDDEGASQQPRLRVTATLHSPERLPMITRRSRSWDLDSSSTINSLANKVSQ